MLQSSTISRDEDGFPIEKSDNGWETIASCRADDDGVTEYADERGRVLRASYHIVADKCSVALGDYVRVPERGIEGRVVRKASTNYLSYTEVWV